MSDDDKIPPEERDLEAGLSRLVPSKLNVEFIDELVRDHERILSVENQQPRRSKWIIPALLACSIVLVGTTFRKFREVNQQREIAVKTAPLPEAKSSTNDFMPISSEGYLINAASRGIIDSAEGPQERFELRFEDFHHWHNPDTATNIRIFSPRREIITIPVETD